jgi:hypothetical protein
MREHKVGRIFACQPSYSGGMAGSHRAFWVGACKKDSPYHGKLTLGHQGGSLLASAFNGMYCHALNLQEVYEDGWNARLLNKNKDVNPFKDDKERMQWYWNAGYDDAETGERKQKITHFAMLHDDIIPDEGWLDILMDGLIAMDADLCAAVVPIKDFFGLTSTAIDDPTDLHHPYGVERRITMAELDALPDIFTAADCGYPDRFLLANTGCWVCRLDQPWNRETDERGYLKAFFTIKDNIWKQDNGRWVNGVAPEDWNFSRALGAMGAKVVCTKRILLEHYGKIGYNSKDTSWGFMKYDNVFGHKFDNKPIGFKEEEAEEEKVNEYVDDLRSNAFNETVLARS